MSGSAGAPALGWGLRSRRRAAWGGAVAAVALACGTADGVEIPRVQATAPVDDEADLAGAPRPGVVAGGDPSTGAQPGTDTGDGDGTGGGMPSTGGGGDANTTLGVGLHLSYAGRRVLTGADGAATAATWRATWSPAGEAFAVDVWPDAPLGAPRAATDAPSGAPLLTLQVPPHPPLGVSMEVAAERGAEGALMWGRLRIDLCPPPGNTAPEAELAGDFELFGPSGVLAGTFRARPASG